MQYNKIPIVMDQFNSFVIKNKQTNKTKQKPYILRKVSPFLLQGTIVYL